VRQVVEIDLRGDLAVAFGALAESATHLVDCAESPGCAVHPRREGVELRGAAVFVKSNAKAG
jgi:hypothetical protein